MRVSKFNVAAIAAGLLLGATSADAKILSLSFDNGKGTLTPTCSASATEATCFVDPSSPGSTWSDASGRNVSTLKAYGKGTVNGSDATLKDRIKLMHDYTGNGKKSPMDTDTITEVFKTLSYSNGLLSITNDAGISGESGDFSYTSDFEINPAGAGSPWVTVASFTDDGSDLINLATFPGLDLVNGEKFSTRIVTTADYDYSGITDCSDGCNSIFRDRVTAEFVPEPSSLALAGTALGLFAMVFGWRRRQRNWSSAL